MWEFIKSLFRVAVNEQLENTPLRESILEREQRMARNARTLLRQTHDSGYLEGLRTAHQLSLSLSHTYNEDWSGPEGDESFERGYKKGVEDAFKMLLDTLESNIDIAMHNMSKR